MAAIQNDVQKDLPPKKELRKQLAEAMEQALPELRELLGEKKFAHRLKKAAKLLTEGLHKEEAAELPATTKALAVKKARVASAKKAAATKKAASGK